MPESKPFKLKQKVVVTFSSKAKKKIRVSGRVIALPPAEPSRGKHRLRVKLDDGREVQPTPGQCRAV